MTTSGKPRKKDFTDMREFMRVAAAWAEANRNEWPWGGPKDEDDDYYFTTSQPNAETIAAFKDIEDGGGEVFYGSAEDMIATILADDEGSVT